MDERDARFLESIFRRYYYDHASEIPVPDSIARREFGYQKFGMSDGGGPGGGGMIRHLQILDAGQMRVLFVRNAPSDVYYSNAYYSFPTMDMAEKDWQGADLIFDIDAKDLALPCREKHVLEACTDCCRVAVSGGDGGGDNHTCGACGGASGLRRRSLPCEKCVDASKEQVRLLREVLCDDLGVPPEEITVYFSGNEGFHLHVLHGAFRDMDARARTDLVDYITLRGLIPETMGMRKGNPDKGGFPDLDEAGWRGRFARAAFGSKTRRAKTITELLSAPAGEGYARFQDMMKGAVSKAGVRIDPHVTMDVHRVFRMPGTLNSKSGMVKAPCADVAEFDPYVDAVVLDGTERVEVVADCPVRFRLNGMNIGPYRNEEAELPGYAAAYMMCKGLAKKKTG